MLNWFYDFIIFIKKLLFKNKYFTQQSYIDMMIENELIIESLILISERKFGWPFWLISRKFICYKQNWIIFSFKFQILYIRRVSIINIYMKKNELKLLVYYNEVLQFFYFLLNYFLNKSFSFSSFFLVITFMFLLLL